MFKKVLGTILVLIVIYLLFVGIDCYRLSKSKFNTPPLVIIKQQKIDYENKVSTKYFGIGYTVDYYTYFDITDNNEMQIVSSNGAECRIFGIMVWAWIE